MLINQNNIEKKLLARGQSIVKIFRDHYIEDLKRLKSSALGKININNVPLKKLDAGDPPIMALPKNVEEKLSKSHDFKILQSFLQNTSQMTYENYEALLNKKDSLSFEDHLEGKGFSLYILTQLKDDYGMFLVPQYTEAVKGIWQGNSIGNTIKVFAPFDIINNKSYSLSIVQDSYYKSISAVFPIKDKNGHTVAILGLDYVLEYNKENYNNDEASNLTPELKDFKSKFENLMDENLSIDRLTQYKEEQKANGSTGRCLVKKVAPKLHVSFSTFSRRIEDIYGVKFQEQKDRIRKEKVFPLLKQEIQIQDIAIILDFGSHASFTKWFKKHFVHTPKNWTKKEKTIDLLKRGIEPESIAKKLNFESISLFSKWFEKIFETSPDKWIEENKKRQSLHSKDSIFSKGMQTSSLNQLRQ